MYSSTNLSIKERLFVATSFCLGSILLTAGLFAASGTRIQRTDTIPLVQDKTGAFQLINAERIEDRFVLRLQNTSRRIITAHAQAVCDVPESSTDYTIGDSSIAPGASIELVIPAKVLSANCGPEISQPVVTIVTAIFEDKTYAGDFRWAKGIFDDRKGQRVQLKRINDVLSKALKRSGEATTLEEVRAEIDSLPIDEAEAPAVRGGLSTAKRRVLYLLGELGQWDQARSTAQSGHSIALRQELAGIKSLKEGIQRLVNLNEKWISRY